jgi:hypothetical protein
VKCDENAVGSDLKIENVTKGYRNGSVGQIKWPSKVQRSLNVEVQVWALTQAGSETEVKREGKKDVA